ncbi:signal recognition particle, SRP19 subunit [Cercophora newfieldiana]|uniref:Signal recognition particle, SRP19 subunit n=1 Tax=Cercophora newfieldiana TaxID=92897 RepID=A0AA40CVF5_9PEZI|nr:signal recognition particle, SRP19 subunit [Cercophora newfieldiana]
MQTTTDDSAYRAYQCIYPVYFDATRTRAEGRRVASHLAVRNPLAAEIVAACASLRLPAVYEAGKLHPKDWANPGRVRVSLKEPSVAARIKNKHHLYLLIAKHLREHPVTEDGPALRMIVRGAPPPPQVEDGKPWPRPAVPRGWKMGELLPYYSPAMTGGGVSENFLKDMMKEMGGGGDMASMLAAAAGGGGGPSGSGSSGGKKDKKGKGK